MMAGPEKANSGPNEPPPIKPGHRGQLARLIRERLVSVNLPDQSGDRNFVTCEPTGPSSRRQIEKRYSNHELAGIHGSPFRAKTGCSDGFGKRGRQRPGSEIRTRL